MLKNIPPILSPDLLYVLANMGHGDEIIIADGNFPADSSTDRLIRCDGHGVPEVLEAVLQLLPLDDFVDHPATLMKVVPGKFDQTPPIWAEYRRIWMQAANRTTILNTWSGLIFMNAPNTPMPS